MKIFYRVFLITYLFFYFIEKINTISRNTLDKQSLKFQKLNNKNNIKYCKKCTVDKVLKIFSIVYLEINNNKSNINIITKSKGYKPLKIAVCAIGKNENLYIREWVEYYKNLGITKIFLYDNNDLNGERFEEVINDYITTGFIKISNWRGKIKTTKNHQEQLNGTTIQGQAYKECYYNNYKNYDWIAFFDIDEFLSIVYKYNNVNEFLNDFNDYDGIKVQWRMYGDKGNLYYENKPVIERFKNKENMGYFNRIKTILKSKKYNFNLKFNAHTAMNEELYIVNLKKERVTDFWSDIRIYKNLPVYLDHFYSKSTEEYIKRKYKKTSAAHGELSTWNFSLKSVKKRYFRNNKITKEKLNLFNKYKKKLNERFKLINYKYCLCTILNDESVIGFETMLYSFFKYNNWFNGDILVMHDDNYSILSDESKKEILLKFPNIKFLKINNSKYNELSFNSIKKKFIPLLLKFEIFGLINYDKVLYINSDTLVISNIYELFNRNENLICFTNENHLVKDVEIWNNIFDGSKNTHLNNGVIFINKNMLNKTHVDGMLNLAYKYDKSFSYYNGCPDQDIMQEYFIENNIKVTLGPNTYNTIEEVFYGNNKKISNEKIIHYIINKPWNSNEPGYEYINNIWRIYHKAYKELYKLKRSSNQKLLLHCKKRCPNQNRKLKRFCKKCLSLDMLDKNNIFENNKIL